MTPFIPSRRVGKYFLAAIAALIFLLQASAAANAGIHGRVMGQQKDGKFVGMVASAEIEFKNLAGNVAAQTTTNENGYYRVKLSPGQYYYKITAPGYKDEDAGRGLVLELSDGYAIYNFSLTKGENDPDREAPVVPVVEVGKLYGRVLENTDEGEVGIPNAIITLRRDGSLRPLRVISRRADEPHESGQYEVVLPAGTWRASVLAFGFERLVDPEPIRIVSGQDTERDFVLTRREPDPDIVANQGIHGRVSAVQDGQGIPTPRDTKIDIIALPGKQLQHATGMSDAQGSYSQETMPGAYYVVATAEGFRKAVRPAFVFSDRFTIANLTLRARSEPEPVKLVVAVHVLERTKRGPLPVADAEVLMRISGGALESQGRTDAKGQLQAVVEKAGKYDVLARKSGYPPRGVKLQVDKGQPNLAEIWFGRSEPEPEPEPEVVTVSGYVACKDSAGRGQLGIPDCRLTWRRTDKGEALERSVTSGVKGTYSLELAEGSYEVLVQPPKNFLPLTERVFVRKAMGPKNFILRRADVTPDERLVTVTGKVYFEATRPRIGYARITGAKLTWQRTDPFPPIARSTTSVDPGSYSIKLPEGTYRVKVDPPSAEFLGSMVTVEVRQGMRSQDFRLKRRVVPDEKPEPSQVSVSGYVVTRSSRSRMGYAPVANANVVFGRKQGSESARTSSLGTFKLRLPADVYSVNVEASSYEELRTRIEVRLGMKPLRLVLNRKDTPDVDKGLPLNLRIVQYDRKLPRRAVRPVGGAEIVISQAGRTVASGRSGTSGTYTARLKPGSYDVRVTHSDFTPAKTSVVLSQSGFSRQIVLSRETGPSPTEKKTLTVRVVERPRTTTVRSGLAISGASVSVLRSGKAVASGTTDRSGSYRVQLERGAYLIKVVAKGYGSGGSQAVVATRDVTQTVQLTRIGTKPVKPSVTPRPGIDRRPSERRPSFTPGTTKPKSLYVVEYLPKGEKTWREIGRYSSQLEAQRARMMALRAGKIPRSSQTRVVMKPATSTSR